MTGKTLSEEIVLWYENSLRIDCYTHWKSSQCYAVYVV